MCNRQLVRAGIGVVTLCLCCASSQSWSAEPADAEARWYKGNLHTHSLWSDGNDFPEMICDWYVRNGYDFLALSDHNILSKGEKWVSEDAPSKRGAIQALKRYRARFGNDWVETRGDEGRLEIRLKALGEFRSMFEKPGEFLLIQAEEITDHFGSLPVHVNANNLMELIRPQGGESVRATIANNLIAVQRQSLRLNRPILAHLNHPNFGYAVTAEDMAEVLQEQFFEIYNGHPGVNQLGDDWHADLERLWDVANTIRLAEIKQPPLYGLATDDSHNYFGNRGASPGRGWVMVRASGLEADSIVEAIQAGDFYASSGVQLERVSFDPTKKQLTIHIQTAEGVQYVTEFIGTTEGYDRKSEPVFDKQGNRLNVTRLYSADVGRVLARVEGAQPNYRLTGKEYYVRAVITSTKAHDNPSYAEQTEQAWTQPVGWQERIVKRSE